MIPAVLSIGQEVEELCPNARFFNYANPMTAIVRALNKSTRLEIVGLCSGVDETLRYLARYIDAPFESVTARWAGVNHLTWILDIRADGASLWPQIRQKIAEERRDALRPNHLGRMFWDEEWQPSSASIEDAPFSWELFDELESFPAPMDRHVVEFFPERFRDGRYFGKILGQDAYSFDACIAYGDQIYQQIVELAKGTSDKQSEDELALLLQGEPSQLIEIIRSLEQDLRRWFSVNVPNRGAVDGLPDDAILELPGAATGDGFCIARIGELPPALTALLLSRLAAVEATVEAAMSGNRKLVAEAMILDGGVSDYSTAVSLTDELIKAQSEYLPQF